MVKINPRGWVALVAGVAFIAAAVGISSVAVAAQAHPAAMLAEGLFSGVGLVMVCLFLRGVRRA
jgi:hypothetical protein